MSLPDDIRLYMPKYLSAESEDALFAEVATFPENEPFVFYSLKGLPSSALYQGDGLKSLPFVSLPDTRVKSAAALVVSNSCDIDPANKRLLPPSILYCPIVGLEKYRRILLEESVSDDQIDSHFAQLRRQRVTSMMFLPKSGSLDDDYVALFDRITNAANRSVDRTTLSGSRLFSLSNFGFYLLLVKLSIHFTRVREGVDRQ